MKTYILLTLLLVGANLGVAAQGRDSGTRESFASSQEETELQNQLEILNGQLSAIQTEMKRRMDCQQKTRVSTATGCVDIPGLEGATLNRVNQQNAAAANAAAAAAAQQAAANAAAAAAAQQAAANAAAAAAAAATQDNSSPATNSYSAESLPPPMTTVCHHVGEGAVEVCQSINPDMIMPDTNLISN
jgi:pyruvate/2-oxoglutarate dehydrogenase complex dihydrolipoamide acyltransferase (E2) component